MQNSFSQNCSVLPHPPLVILKQKIIITAVAYCIYPRTGYVIAGAVGAMLLVTCLDGKHDMYCAILCAMAVQGRPSYFWRQSKAHQTTYLH